MTEQEAEVEQIECRVAPWYYKRMGLISLMLLGCGLWFLYDGMVGYPAENHRVDIHDAFAAARDGETWESIAGERGWPIESGAGDEKHAEVRAAYEAAAAGESWSAYSAEHRLPEGKGKRHPQSDIDGQFHWSYGSFALGGLVLVLILINAPKVLRADAESFTTPSGKRVTFASIFRVDKKKWDNKGLAYTYYRDDSGRDRKAVIDDLKYRGADRILEQVLANFEGEIVERVRIDEEEEEEEEEGGAEDVAEKEKALGEEAGEGAAGESGGEIRRGPNGEGG